MVHTWSFQTLASSNVFLLFQCAQWRILQRHNCGQYIIRIIHYNNLRVGHNYRYNMKGFYSEWLAEAIPIINIFLLKLYC